LSSSAAQNPLTAGHQLFGSPCARWRMGCRGTGATSAEHQGGGGHRPRLEPPSPGQQWDPGGEARFPTPLGLQAACWWLRTEGGLEGGAAAPPSRPPTSARTGVVPAWCIVTDRRGPGAGLCVHPARL